MTQSTLPLTDRPAPFAHPSAGLSDKVTAAASRLREIVPQWISPNSSRRILGVVLGSGLGTLVDRIEDAVAVGYDQLPGLARSSVAGHRGQFLLGRIGSTPVIAMAGRLHVYEGHELPAVTRPIEVMAAMGVTDLIVSCAAGGLNPRLSVGDCCLIDERISWLRGAMGKPVSTSLDSPLPLPHVSRAPCNLALVHCADATARRNGWTLQRGTYLAVNGPNYETRAECRMMRTMGVDLVGMSTVPELIAAATLDIRALAIAIVTNLAIPDAAAAANHEEVLVASSKAAGKLLSIVESIAGSCHPSS